MVRFAAWNRKSRELHDMASYRIAQATTYQSIRGGSAPFQPGDVQARPFILSRIRTGASNQ
jgi:hypothetical protein